MKLIALKCPTCGAYVDVREGSRKAVCAFCDTPFLVDEELKREKADPARTIMNEVSPADDVWQTGTARHADDAWQTGTASPADDAWHAESAKPSGAVSQADEWLPEAPDPDRTYSGTLPQSVPRTDADRAFQYKKTKWRVSLVIIAAFLVFMLYLEGYTLFWVVLVLGGIVLLTSYPRRRLPMEATRYDDREASRKSQVVALLLCICFGFFGVHYFYVGKVGKGILYLLTLGLFGIGWIVDVIRIVCGVFRDSEGYYLRN